MVVDPLSAIAEVEVEALVGIIAAFFIPFFAIPSAGFGAWAWIVAQKSLDHHVTNDHCQVENMAQNSKLVAIYTFISIGVTVGFAIFILLMSVSQLLIGVIPYVGYLWVYMKWAVGNLLMLASMALVYVAFVYGIIGFVEGTKCGSVPYHASEADKRSFPYLWAFLLVNFIINCLSALSTVPVFIGLVLALPINAIGILIFLLLLPIIAIILILAAICAILLGPIVVVLILLPCCCCCLWFTSGTFRRLCLRLVGADTREFRIQRGFRDEYGSLE